jgi:hypothetical protein
MIATAALISINESVVLLLPPSMRLVQRLWQRNIRLLLWNQMEALDHVDLVDSGWRDLSSQTTPDRRATPITDTPHANPRSRASRKRRPHIRGVHLFA